MKNIPSVTICLGHIQNGLELIIDEKNRNTLFLCSNAREYGEAPHQIVEGCQYEYEFNNSDYAFDDLAMHGIVQPTIRRKHRGRLVPNIYVGTLNLSILFKGKQVGSFAIEVQSVKASYRDDYRSMLEYITEQCTDLLMQSNSPVSQHFETDYTQNCSQEALYQKFAFIYSVLGTEEFTESLHRIVSAPVTKWKETEEQKDIRQIRRFSNKNIKQLTSGVNRMRLPDGHSLQSSGMQSIPHKLSAVRKVDTVDTPENRFIKHALEVFHKFCADVQRKAVHGSKLYVQAVSLVTLLESKLQHSIFKEISRPSTLTIGSPVLQRKEGYREVLRIWLMFDLAVKLVWKGGDDVYSADKKDIAVLYEYWLFFKLLNMFRSIFAIEPKDLSDLIKPDTQGLNLQIKQGVYTPLRGKYKTKNRELNVKFNYNRSFNGASKPISYPDAGSWTTTMRPDYTLSIWPSQISESEAEKDELIVHIHFDAKYKVANMNSLFDDADLDSEKTDQRKGIYKNADLLKMHAYKDAIRRTGGAYVLYPGDVAKNKKGFHEVLPGLGAFPVRPSVLDDGIHDLKAFVNEVIQHFLNRASHREKLAHRIWDIHKNGETGMVNETMPEPYGKNRSLIPDDTTVIIGYCKSEAQYEWIKNNKLYNFRAGTASGSLELEPAAAGATYLLIHGNGDKFSNKMWRITSKGPKIFSKADLQAKGYGNPTGDYYLVYTIEEVDTSEFGNVSWDYSSLPNFPKGFSSAKPFTVTLTDLMRTVITY